MESQKCVMFKLITLTIITLLSIPRSDSARILCVFSFPSKSHQAFYRTLTQELLRRGHELVVVTTEPSTHGKTPWNLKEIEVSNASQIVRENLAPCFKLATENPDKIDMPKLGETLHVLFMEQFWTEDFQKIIKGDKKFDLLLLESCIHSNLILSHLFKAPVVLVSSQGSMYNYDNMGVPIQEFIYPSLYRRCLVKPSFWAEIYDVYYLKMFERDFVMEDVQNEAFKSIVEFNTPTMKELYHNIDMFLPNQYSIWEGIRPMPPNVIHVGGIHTKPRKELPQDLQNFLNSSENGVIYVSFGTVLPMSELSSEKVQVMVKVLSDLPYDVLWKCDHSDFPGKGTNIRTFQWLPQADILKHPKVKLLITHGGLHSSEEAIDAGVPVIGMPFISDQFFNTANYERYGIGLRVHFGTLTVEGLRADITKVISDKRYRENIVRLKTILHDQPHRALGSAAWWVEYVLRHGGAKHLRSPAADIHWTQYLELELACIVLFGFTLFLSVFLIILYRFCRLAVGLFRRSSRNNKDK